MVHEYSFGCSENRDKPFIEGLCSSQHLLILGHISPGVSCEMVHITKTFSTLGNSFRFIVISNEVEMYQLEGCSNHHWDHWSPFLPPSIELTSSAILDCPVDIFVDTQPPESIRDKALCSLLVLVSRITMTTINGSPPVCPWHYEVFHFFNLVFWCVYVVQQSSIQGQPVCISQQAFPCRSVLVWAEARLELQ